MVSLLVGAATLIGGAVKAGGALIAAHPLAFGIGATTALSAGTAIFQGIQGSRQGKAQAAQIGLQTEGQQLQYAIESKERQRRLQSILASQNALFGQANIDLGSGTPLSIANQSVADAAEQQRNASLFNQVQTSQLGVQQKQFITQGRNSLFNGLLGASTSLINVGLASATRGSVPTARSA